MGGGGYESHNTENGKSVHKQNVCASEDNETLIMSNLLALEREQRSPESNELIQLDTFKPI